MSFTTYAPSIPGLRILLAVCVAVSFFLNIQAIPLFDLDEGAFSEATREMLVRGDFISTYLDGSPRYDKPILIYWLQALSVLAFGVNEFAFRLPSALAATLWIFSVFLFTRRIQDERSGLAAAIITATAFEVSVMASAATADALLNLLISSCMFSIFLYWRERENRWLYSSFALIGLGFLTKGPVAVLIPLAVSFLFFASKGALKQWLRLVFNPIGIALFLAIALPWYLAQYMKEGDAFIQGFFFKHNIDRFQAPMEKHAGSLFYYIPVLLLATLPFPTLLLKTLSRFKTHLQNDFALFSLIWFGFVFIFFSFSATKLPHYLLYGLSGLFILMATDLAELRSRFWLFLPPLIWFVLLLFLPEVMAGILPRLEDPFAREMIEAYPAHFSLTYRLFFIAAILFTLFCMVERRLHSADKILLMGLACVLSLSLFLLPIIGAMKQGPIKEAAALANREGYKVVRWKLNTPSFSVYTQKVTESRRPRPGEVVLTKNKYLKDLIGYELLYRRGGVAMARIEE